MKKEKYITYILKEVNMQFLKCLMLVLLNDLKEWNAESINISSTEGTPVFSLQNSFTEKLKYNSLLKKKKGKKEDIFWIINKLQN